MTKALCGEDYAVVPLLARPNNLIVGANIYFDTNTGEHQHFYHEDDGILSDIPVNDLAVAGVPVPPHGTKVSRVDVVVRLRRS